MVTNTVLPRTPFVTRTSFEDRYDERMAPTPAERRAARHAPGDQVATAPAERERGAGSRRPLSVERVTETALAMVARDGYEALTMRRLAAELGTGAASLYAHVVNKEDLDELLIGALCAQLRLPEPDPARWREQVTDVCTQLRDVYLAHPGISRAALAAAPTNRETLRLSEGLLALLVAGATDPQAAAWGMDALVLYVGAYCLEVATYERRRRSPDDTWVVSREELLDRFAALPDTFPQTKRYAAELTSGEAHQRFDFTLGLLLDGLAAA
jgi:AcrR family transcriptional regulator